ncbi:amidohydrolase [Lacrimispora saccharolytica]|uniref:Amidohydrolase n=1 Tax=Lacrimispora saccharolytica (strain ATCC 35040 / DSM 2544 / NRCC 2533 / WM1) TaxID=610130 RepID=D9R7S0_LACSW|nr:amidohydrolase [Lacrimispora saccharolytica]ADL05574.1 amidohydrolase [[Clostridium] saccharolyticum WM1]QRV20266.1 amidohydrolase [Lacrimispora saccharolytica]
MRTIIINVTVVTMNDQREIHDPGFVMFENDIITAVGDMKDLPDKAGLLHTVTVDGRNGILMPGMVNLHTHMGMVPFRGLGDDCKDRLRVFLLPMEQKTMDEELVYLSTRYGAGEMLLGGVTTALDMYYFEEEAAKAMDEMGMRGITGQTVMDEGACDFAHPREALAYGENLIKKYRSHPRISACIAPHGTNTCGEDLLLEAYRMDSLYKVPFPLHMAEMDYEMDYFRKEYGMTPVRYLDSLHVLGEETLAAHCIHMTEEDLLLFKEKGARVAHCIGSNTKAAKGVAPVSSMLRLAIPVGLGTDGPASGNTLDIFTQMKLCANFHKNETRDRSAFPAETIVAMATIQGAKAMGLHDLTGSLEPGKQADMVLVETHSPNMFPVYNPYSALVYSANPSNVEEVYVAGECLVKGKKLVKSDMDEIRKALSEKMKKTDFGIYMAKMGNIY